MIDPYEYHIADEMKRTRTPDKTMTAETDLLPLPEWTKRDEILALFGDDALRIVPEAGLGGG